MQANEKTTKVVASVLALAGLVVFSLMGYAGNLEPTAPPGPTMKTLDEVEPRIPIHASDLPLTITEPNSYYLVEDVNFTDTSNHAIKVECNDVTIDLMGYTLKGPDSGEKSGIYIDPLSNVEVRNGTIRDFGWWPIYAKYGNETSGSHRVINIRALSNGFGIVLFGKGNLVKDCTAGYNVGSFGGIYGGWGGTVTGNTAYNNGAHGIRAADGSTVTGNTAYYNEGDGIGTDSNCTVTGNTVSNNKDNGIETASGCTVTGNTANYNNRSDSSDFAGIYVTDDCMVKGNTCHGNKRNNIYVDGSDNAIEEHLLTDCSPGNGIYFNDIGNFYANNRFSGNDTDVANPGFQTNGGGNYPF